MPVSDNNEEEIRNNYSCLKPNIQRQGPGAQNTSAKGIHWSWSSGSPKERENIGTQGLDERHFLVASANNSKRVAFSFFLLR